MGLFARVFGRNQGNSHYQRGLALARDGKTEQAIEAYSAAATAADATAEVVAMAIFNRSLAYTRLRRNEEALADLNRVLGMPEAPASVLEAARDKVKRRSRTSGRNDARPSADETVAG